MLQFRHDAEEMEREHRSLVRMGGTLRTRAAMYRALRSFFDREDFLEVQTPVRLPAPALEDYIDALPAGDGRWLRTSPELHMKRLLAAGHPRIYQIGPCFRAGEDGARHLPEFTMLEWYRLDADWRKVQDDAVRLVREAAAACLPPDRELSFRGRRIDLAAPWDEITVEEAFRRHAHADLAAEIAGGRFEETLVTEIEPRLGLERPCFLTEYPLFCSGLSRPIPGRPDFVERWELYVAGLELGNACSELVDPDEQERRFERTARLRSREGRPVYPVDQPFLNALRRGMPPAAGVAIGLDRLLMALCGCDRIRQVAFTDD